MAATSRRVSKRAPAGAPAEPIGAVADELRAALQAVLQPLGAGDPRPMTLSRRIGIDKSLASVLVRAANAPTDLALLQLVPSPTGLRIFAERAGRHAPRPAIARLRNATDRFRTLLDATPGGRAALDARLAEGAHDLGRKRENSSRQSTFKSSAFLLGYFSEVLCSSLFLIPSEDGSMVDGVEVTRRLGVRRMRSTTTVPIFSFIVAGEGRPPDRSTYLEAIDPAAGAPSLANLVLPEFSTQPLPDLEVVREGPRTTVLLPGGSSTDGPMDMTWAIRLRNGGPVNPGAGSHALNGYFLHMPTRRLVRDLFIADTVYPGATPFVTFALPGTEASRNPPRPGSPPYYGQIDLTAELEPLPASGRGFAIPGVPDHDRLTRDVLARSGHAHTRFRGWRCVINYPLPLIQMLFWLAHPDHGR